MKIEEFIEHFADLFEDNSEELTAQTRFKELSQWNSLMLLAVLETVEKEYEVSLKGQEIQNVSTLQDLFKIVELKKTSQFC